MEYKLPFTSDNFLSQLKEDFYTTLLVKYKNLVSTQGSIDEILELFSPPCVQESDVTFTYVPLLLGDDEEEDERNASENIKRLYESLRHLTTSQAAMEKIWVALLNTYYVDYHLHVIRRLRGHKDANQQIWDRTFVSGRNGEKRQQLMNNLSLMWWIGHYTYDKDNAVNPYHLTEFFTEAAHRGNALAFFSSNIHGNRNITLGILDGVKHLVGAGVIKVNRYAYTNSSKIINIIAGVNLVDLMTREEVRDIIIRELPKSDSVMLV